MTRIIKRQKQRIIRRRLHFTRSPTGAVYCKEGCLQGFWHDKYFYITIRNGDMLQWKRAFFYGVKMKIPKWVTSELRRKGCVNELALLDELRRWIEDGPHDDPTRVL